MIVLTFNQIYMDNNIVNKKHKSQTGFGLNSGCAILFIPSFIPEIFTDTQSVGTQW